MKSMNSFAGIYIFVLTKKLPKTLHFKYKYAKQNVAFTKLSKTPKRGSARPSAHLLPLTLSLSARLAECSKSQLLSSFEQEELLLLKK